MYKDSRQELIEDIINVLEKHELKRKHRKHPVCILLDHHYLGNVILGGNIKPENLRQAQQHIIEEYNKSDKPEELRDVEEAYNFITNRINQVLDEGCSEKAVNSLYEDYQTLQRKFRNKGYDVHL